MAKKTKNQLGGHVYIVQKTDEGHCIQRVPNEGEGAETYFIDKNGTCNCRASEFGNSCKHQAMAAGNLRGPLLPKLDAGDILEDYLDQLRTEWPSANLVSLVRYKRATPLSSATALAHGVLAEHPADSFTVWAEFKSFLIRVHCFKNRDDYRRALNTVRRQWTNDNYQGTEHDMGTVGQTYGGN